MEKIFPKTVACLLSLILCDNVVREVLPLPTTTSEFKNLERLKWKEEPTFELSDEQFFKDSLWIQELDKDSIEQVLYDENEKRPWLVLFYANWCGHCQRYAPQYQHYSYSFQKWNDYVAIGAVDCYASDNSEICRKYDVSGYPTLLMFLPPYSQNIKPTHKQIHGHDPTIEIVNELESHYNFQSQVLDHHDLVTAQAFPDLTSTITIDSTSTNPMANLSETTREKIMNGTENRSTISLILVHSTSSQDLGRQSLLDLHALMRDLSTSSLNFIRAIDDESRVTQSKSFLSILKYNWNSNQVENRKEIHCEDDDVRCRVLIYNTALQMISGEGGFGDHGQVKSEIQHIEKKKPEVPGVSNPPNSLNWSDRLRKRRYTNYLWDLEKALLQSLEKEVATHQTIEKGRLTALIVYLETLTDFFPSRPEVHRFLVKLLKWVKEGIDFSSEDPRQRQFFINKKVIEGSDLKEKIRVLKSEAFPHLVGSNSSYVGCEGSKPRFGGYTCALWMTWHTMSVAEYQISKKRQELKKITDFDEDFTSDRMIHGRSKHSHHHVLIAMIEYVRSFFSCNDCTQHFLTMTHNGNLIQDHVNSSESSLIWLWKNHNTVNLRLDSDLSSVSNDPVFPRGHFPDGDHCQTCGAIHGLDTNYDRVIAFLVDLYSFDNINFERMDENSTFINGGVDAFDLEEDDGDGIQDLHVRRVRRKIMQGNESINMDDVNVLASHLIETSHKKIKHNLTNSHFYFQTFIYLISLCLTFIIYSLFRRRVIKRCTSVVNW